MQWQPLLDAIADGLTVFQTRLTGLDGAADAAAPPVIYAPGRVVAGVDECLLGLGRHWHRSDGAEPVPVPHLGLCINNKGTQPHPGQGRAFGGLTELAVAAEPWRLDAWAALVGADREPARFFRRFTLVVEDASPDSCLGLIVLLARLNGVEPGEIPAEWVRYTALWELGNSRMADPFTAWGPLHTALAHCHFDDAVIATSASKAELAEQGLSASRAVARAWLACLRFDLALLRAGASPYQVRGVAPCQEADEAEAFLNYEQQLYRQGLEQAQTLQLLVPMVGQGKRFKVVDAYLDDQSFPIPSGSLKVFLRTDREHPWLGDGFGLMGVYHAALAGTGSDMAISVDPAVGVHLRDLWLALEDAEDARWGAERPCGDPRLGILGYPDGRRPGDDRPSPDQPWYDGGDYSLVAAPKQTAAGPGSRLAWRDDVLECLWACYSPVRFLKLVDARGRLCPIADCNPEHLGGTGKHYLRLSWPRASRRGADPVCNQEPILFTPTVQRCLTALAIRALPRHGLLPRLAELPPMGSFDFLRVPGGLVLVHGDGVFVLDDWGQTDVADDAIRVEINRVVERLRVLGQSGERARRLLATIGDYLARGRWRALGSLSTLGELSEIKIHIREGLNATAMLATDPEIAALRQALEQRWGVASQLEQLYATLDQTEDTLRRYGELRSGRLIAFLSIFGFPVVLLAGFFQFILAGMPPTWPEFVDWVLGRGTTPGPHWLGLGVYIASAVTLIILLKVGWALFNRLKRSTKP